MNIRFLLPLCVSVLTAFFVGCGDPKDEANKPDEESKSQSGGSDGEPSKADKESSAILARSYCSASFEGKNPAFDSLDAVVATLSDDELRELIENLGAEDFEGLRGWMRVVLFSEWAARDPNSAYAFAEGLLAENVAWPRQQALYGVFRGWARKDAQAALAAWVKDKPQLEPGERPKLSDHWREHALREVFQVLSRTDAQGAYERLTREDYGTEALLGFFQGLDPRDLRNYAEFWAKQWNKRNVDLAKALPADKSAHLYLGERVGKVIASAKAEKDLTIAEEWLSETGPKDETLQRGLRAILYEKWSSQNPKEALTLLGNADNHNPQVLPRISRGIIMGDPSLGPQVMAAIKDLKLRETAIRYSIQGFQTGMGGSQEYLPVTGGGQQFPDYQASYDALLKTVEAGGFREDRAATFHKLMDKIFAGKLDEG